MPGVQAQSNAVLSQGFPSSKAFDPLLLGITARGTESPLSPTGGRGLISWRWHIALKRGAPLQHEPQVATYRAESNAALASHLSALGEQEKETQQ